MIYAQITNNKIINIIDLEDPTLLPLFQTDSGGNKYDSVIQIDTMSPQPGIDWIFDNINWNPPGPPPPLNLTQIYMNSIQNAMNFGQQLSLQFAATNVMAGITQAGKTQAMIDYCIGLSTCLNTGSLYAAIDQINNMIADTSDAKTALSPFLTNNLLYIYLNQIQSYLNLPLTPNPGP